jgi:isocitrate/isopropylmalate dehydrogenase
MSEKVLFLKGDGIGPPVLKSAERILTSMTDSVEIIHGEIGRSAFDLTGQYLPHETMDLLDECNTIFSGPVYPPENKKSPLSTLMVQLDLYARVRHFKTMAPDLGIKDLEVVLWSSNNNVATEISEVQDFDGITLSKYISNNAYNRMMTLALSDVEMRKLSRISCLIRDDFFPVSSGMFKESFETIFTTDKYETTVLNVKDWAAHAFKFPSNAQCIICVDLYNQVVAGVLGGLTGYDHLGPLYFKGDDYTLFRPCNKPSYGDTIESGYENPTSAIMSVATYLASIGLKNESADIMKALTETYIAMERTPDVGGTLTNEEFTNKVLSRI